MAPNSAMKVPVFPILLSPSSPQISPTGLGQGRKGEERRRRTGGEGSKR